MNSLGPIALLVALAPVRPAHPLALPQEAPPAARGDAAAPPARGSAAAHLRLPRAVLLDRSHHLDYGLATFSFLRGIRDDPGLELTRNDWDLQFTNGELYCRTVVDDRSLVIDLTAVDVSELAIAWDWGPRATPDGVTVRPGHTYVVLTRDDDSDIATLLHVVDLQPGRRCTLDWITTDGTGRTQGSMADELVEGRRISEWLEEIHEHFRDERPRLEAPRVRLQARAGAVGGNAVRVYLSGETRRVDDVATEPLEVDGAVPEDTRPIAYAEAGWIPPGTAFVVTGATFHGVAAGDRNGEGRFRVVVGGTTLYTRGAGEMPIQDAWEGVQRLLPGSEQDTYLEISNSSAGELVLTGRFEPLGQADGHPGPWAANPGSSRT